jgi:hypothetical protein
VPKRRNSNDKRHDNSRIITRANTL